MLYIIFVIIFHEPFCGTALCHAAIELFVICVVRRQKRVTRVRHAKDLYFLYLRNRTGYMGATHYAALAHGVLHLFFCTRYGAMGALRDFL